MKKLFFLFSFLFLCSSTIYAQDWLNKLGNKAKEAAKKTVERKVEQKSTEVTNKAMDKVEDEVKGNGNNTNQNNQSSNKNSSKDTSVSKTKGNSEPLKSFTQYDFVPGDKVLFYEDFSQDAVGDFPANWTTNKSGEINTLSNAPGKWLNLNGTEGNWWLLKEIEFPENFIIELDAVPKKGAARYAFGLHLYGESKYTEMSDPNNKYTTGLVIDASNRAWESYGMKSGQPKIAGNSTINLVEQEKVNHVIIWVQKRRVRVYHLGAKVLDMPTNLYQDSKFTRLCFELYRGASSSAYISNIKITTASPDMRGKFMEEGKIVSYGINFDVNKDVVKPESYGTLKEISQILQDNPDVKMKIVGHTDSDGDDNSNLDLSKRRAEAVKNALVNDFGIDENRLQSDGFGEKQPVAKNDTPSNKALNRRVEFIKL